MSVKKNSIRLEIEGIDEEGRLTLGDPASLVMEGWLSTQYDPAECSIELAIHSNQQEAYVALAMADFISAGGPYLCQIDFEPEAAGLMGFHVRLLKNKRKLDEDAVEVRIINPLRDSSGNRRRTGTGALKVKK